MRSRAATPEEEELRATIARVLGSQGRRKLVVAGPGTGKTTLFKQLLEATGGQPADHLVLTFINNLKNDLEEQLKEHASVYTLHGYCFRLLHENEHLRRGLSAGFALLPNLASLIKADWQHLMESEPPSFVAAMRALDEQNYIPFYLTRGNYYDAVDFDDIVYRTYRQLEADPELVPGYGLVLIDEYQDFNALEAGFIQLLARDNPILIAGDDDQALYSQLRASSCEHIRALYRAGAFEVFELPFCMRCPEVVVGAVNDVIGRAQRLRKLEGRIQKPYRHFPPAKGADSMRYPTIALIATSVQNSRANYMGRYIERAIRAIPREEIEAAEANGFPAILVIVAKPYRSQIIEHLEECGYIVDTRRDAEHTFKREIGLQILKACAQSNLGWRIVLEFEPAEFTSQIIRASQNGAPLFKLVTDEYRERTLHEVEAHILPQEPEPTPAVLEPPTSPVVRVTSFEGAKGLSAQHVFIAGLHNGELPRQPNNIQDLEICRFLVGLTRTRKKCYLLYTNRFANQPRTPSCLLTWISSGRYEHVRVDARYWSG